VDTQNAHAGTATTESTSARWWTLAAASIGVFMLLLDLTIVNVALPDIQKELHASLSDLQWVIDAYALSLAALLLTAGSLADLLGRRRVYAVGIAIFGLGSLLCGVAQSPLFLSLARAGQGVGGAVMFATSFALVAQTFHGKERGLAFGVLGAITGVAAAVGPVLGGALTSGISWRWIFFVNLPIAAIAITMTLLRVGESRDPAAARPDWMGFLTFSAALATLVYGLIESNSHAWGSSRVVVSLVSAAVLLGAFIATEVRQPRPMFDLSLLRNPTFVGGLAAAFAIAGSLITLITFLVLYFQNVLGYSAIGTGVRLLALTGAIFFSAGLAGRLTAKVPVRFLVGPGFALVGVGLLLMRGISPSSGWTHFLAGMIVAGVGSSFVNVPVASIAVGVVHPSRAGMGSGVNSTFRQVGLAAGIAAIGSIFASQVRDGVVSGLGGSPLADHSHALAQAIGAGHAAQAIASTPPGLRGQLAAVSTSSFVGGLNDILLISAFIAFAGAALALVLIRQRDFVDSSPHEGVPDGALLASGAS
jgi:EmrB/QacA subfamily drug resistance transporter